MTVFGSAGFQLLALAGEWVGCLAPDCNRAGVFVLAIAGGGLPAECVFSDSCSSSCSKCECGTIYSMWIILRKYEGGCDARLARR